MKNNKKITVVLVCAAIIIAAAVIIAVVFSSPSHKYDSAMNLLNEGNYADAAAEFTELGEYEDSAELVKFCEKEIALTDYLTEFERVQFGSYEQDGNAENGKENLEWIVLDKQDDKILVASLFGIDVMPFHDALEVKIAWSNSSVRQWLNNEFIAEAFNEEEQERLVETELTNNGGSDEKGAADKNTSDKVFLLSADELDKYLPEDANRELMATEAAEENGAKISKNNGNATWWLRAPREIGNHQPIVNNRGEIITKDANGDGGCIRPAMWITAG